MIRDDPSQSELIRPRLAVRVDLVRLLYLPVVSSILLIKSGNIQQSKSGGNCCQPPQKYWTIQMEILVK